MSIPLAPEAGRGGLRKSRIESLADGVFSVALTLLVLDLTVPTLLSPTDSVLWTDLVALLPTLLIYFLSFVVVGTFWVGQHGLFHYIDRVDRYYLWIVILFLMFVVILPFSTLLISHYPSHEPAIVFYGLNLFAGGMLLLASWKYAARFDLLVPGVDQHTQTLVARRVTVGPLLAVAGIALAFLSPYVSLVVYAIIPALYLLPSHVDEHFRGTAHPPAG